ncbi:MAG: hypothetical protein Q4F79_04910 [Eubacteriales bacterium]|nr:hypothetical protein [Eubacteriales bacterium]
MKKQKNSNNNIKTRRGEQGKVNQKRQKMGRSKTGLANMPKIREKRLIKSTKFRKARKKALQFFKKMII